MFRVAAILMFAVFLCQAAGVSLAAVIPCAEQCEDDGPDGQCAPGCEDCVCCAHPRVAFGGPGPAPIPCVARAPRVSVSESSPPEAAVQDILRVPKLSIRG